MGPPNEDRDPGAAWLTGVVGLLVAAVPIVIAWATYAVACDESTSEACSRQSLAAWQLVVALGGLVPVGLTVRAMRRGHRLYAAIWAGSAVLLYVAWALLNDAAVHGWDNLKVFG